MMILWDFFFAGLVFGFFETLVIWWTWKMWRWRWS